MLDAIVSGIDDTVFLAEMAKGRLKSKKEQLEHALVGLVGKHQRMMISMRLRHIDLTQ